MVYDCCLSDFQSLTVSRFYPKIRLIQNPQSSLLPDQNLPVSVELSNNLVTTYDTLSSVPRGGLHSCIQLALKRRCWGFPSITKTVLFQLTDTFIWDLSQITLLVTELSSDHIIGGYYFEFQKQLSVMNS